MPRTGAQYLEDVEDGRSVYLNGARINTVTRHKAYSGAARSIARLYDFQRAPENIERMTFESPGTGDRVSRMWQLPRCHADLVARREALVAWAETHYGFMGRSPDHVASTIAGFRMGSHVYEAHGKKRAEAVRDYYAFARDRDLYLSYVIIDPQGDRSKTRSEGGNADLTVSVCDEDSEGITLRGAKMLGTGAVLSDEILVSTLRPMKAGEERWAFTAMLPMNAPGLRILSRRSYEEGATSEFDYPLSSRYDENDALIYFDEVKVPWERVFVNQDVRTQFAQWHETPAHSYQNYQAEVRLMVKLRFLVGLARRIAETIGVIAFPQVVETLGRLSSQLQVIEAFVIRDGGEGLALRRVLAAGPRAPLRLAGAVAGALPGDRAHAARARGRRHDHGAVLGRGLRGPRARVAHRPHPVLAGDGLHRQGQALQARVGRRGLRVRLAPHPVRDVLLGPEGGDHRHGLPHLRLGPGDRAGRPLHGGVRPAGGRGAAGTAGRPGDGRDST